MIPISNEPLHRFAHEAMGTIYELMIAGEEQSYAGQAAQAVFREIERLEGLFSRFNACSEIGQINRLEPGGSLRIGLETYECLRTAEQVRLETEGAFDVNFRKRTSGSWLPSYEVHCGASGFFIRIRSGVLGQKAERLDLDLGGIGKGYALDRAVSILSDWSIRRYLVHGGTSTAAAAGSAPGLRPGESGWPVGVGGGWELPGMSKRVLLKDRALSGSGTEVKGRHIKEPKTGRPADAHQAAWVSHPSAAAADALSTAFMVMDTKEVKGYCRRHPEVWAQVITRKGTALVINEEAFQKDI
jgi:thiamine biosynthesis lipoprotein